MILALGQILGQANFTQRPIELQRVLRRNYAHLRFIEKFIGEKMDRILSNTDKSTFICHLERPLVLHKRIVIAAPPLTEHENGFGLWVTKLANLAQELSIPILIYCHEATRNSVEKVFLTAKLTAAITVEIFSEWEDFLVLSRNTTAICISFCPKRRYFLFGNTGQFTG
ncbi:hypothetical protein LZF95_08435 [Algoriphagus sp. AGSA1]|uniref:hypothetical protein n=1 Tax=Algoriphagus sp. AGSA1 TaxID=2907213 RepID=UPI001F177A81|nr:hypothetical protein [Algoriphagus sp. AGSA1]MCE7054697.1 hypothetical protein [Algoriphagus sp. AGSA1]